MSKKAQGWSGHLELTRWELNTIEVALSMWPGTPRTARDIDDGWTPSGYKMIEALWAKIDALPEFPPDGDMHTLADEGN